MKTLLELLSLNCGLPVLLKNPWRRWKVCRFLVFFHPGRKRIANAKFATEQTCAVIEQLAYSSSRSVRTIEKSSGRQAGSAASGIREWKGEGGTPPLSLPDPARRPPAFSIVHTDGEPGRGYRTTSLRFSGTFLVFQIKMISILLP